MSVLRQSVAEFARSIKPIDAFICCASYEDRCRSVPEALDPQHVRNVLIVENVNLHPYIADNAKRLHDIFSACATTSTMSVESRTDDPIVFADAFRTSLAKVLEEGPGTLLVDITTFTHESLLVMLKLCRLLADRIRDILLCYVDAAEYAYESKPGSKWLSKGVADIRSVLGYSGSMRPSQATHLLVLVGYEYERASSLIETFEPSVISLGYGRSDDNGHLDASRRFDELLAECTSKYPEVRQFAFPCNDPWDCKRAILAEVAAKPGYNTVIAPLNTKISAVGCALATMDNENIQLCYAQPLQYNYEAYSLPGDSCYSFRIPELWAGLQ